MSRTKILTGLIAPFARMWGSGAPDDDTKWRKVEIGSPDVSPVVLVKNFCLLTDGRFPDGSKYTGELDELHGEKVLRSGLSHDAFREAFTHHAASLGAHDIEAAGDYLYIAVPEGADPDTFAEEISTLGEKRFSYFFATKHRAESYLEEERARLMNDPQAGTRQGTPPGREMILDA